MKSVLLAACAALALATTACVSDAEYARLSQELAARNAKEKCEVTGSRLRKNDCEGDVQVGSAEAFRQAAERENAIRANAGTNASR